MMFLGFRESFRHLDVYLCILNLLYLYPTSYLVYMRELDPIESMHYSTGECLVVEIDYKDIGKDAVLDWIYKNIPYY